MTFRHIPVMPDEVMEALHIRPDGTYVDGTSGGGGHGILIASRLRGGRLFSIDRDKRAVEATRQRFEEGGVADKATVIRGNFADMKQILADEGVDRVDGILLDLGVSSPQIDDPQRGFSYMHDAPLDMRMDEDAAVSAKTIVNDCSEEALTRILREYGEERFAAQIARRIVKEREQGEIKTTFQLNAIIERAIPKKAMQKGSHPSKRTFQAIRIACNEELEILKEAVDDAVSLLVPCGRLAVITFHSLEDRIVKIEFRRMEDPCVCPKDFPVCVCGRRSTGRVVTKKALVPSREELEQNKRAKSAHLRVFEKGE